MSQRWESIAGKSVLVTGGTGSFGRACIRKLLAECAPERVVLFSRDEWKQWEMQQSDPLFASPRLHYVMGDVRDQGRLLRACRGVDYVIHAAALKQISPAERNPSEYVKTNVVGAMHLIDAAVESGVKKVIALSTDKAAHPANLYGATKLCADKLFVAANSDVAGCQESRFSVVRYGNVLGSRGSVTEYWAQLAREGARHLPITDLRMTRFWITIEQAVEFVLDSFSRMGGGEIFVPRIPSMSLVDLMQAVAPGVEAKVMGIRPGEKLHELLIGEEEARNTVRYENYFTILPQHSSPAGWEKIFRACGGVPLEEGFSYSSDRNETWLSVEQLRALLPGEICGGQVL